AKAETGDHNAGHGDPYIRGESKPDHGHAESGERDTHALLGGAFKPSATEQDHGTGEGSGSEGAQHVSNPRIATTEHVCCEERHEHQQVRGYEEAHQRLEQYEPKCGVVGPYVAHTVTQLIHATGGGFGDHALRYNFTEA